MTPVLNLSDPAELSRRELSVEALTRERRAAYPLCHRVAHEAVAAGYRAILAPSAAQSGERVLLVYPESSHGRLRLSNRPDRLALNHGTAPIMP